MREEKKNLFLRISSVLIIFIILGIVFIWGGNYPSGKIDVSRESHPSSSFLPLTESEEDSQLIKLKKDTVEEESKEKEATTPKKAIGIKDVSVKENEISQNQESKGKTDVNISVIEKEETFDEEWVCTLSIQCLTILDNMDFLAKEKWELIPKDGIILPETTVSFSEGETVFDLLLRETKKAKIHFAFRKTPGLNSAYVEGINNLYEFDVGELSGWVYKVNGEFPSEGSSEYYLKDGDVIEWVYTCDLGEDVGRSIY